MYSNIDIVGTSRNEDGSKDNGSCEKYISRFFPFMIIDNFSLSTLHRIPEQEKVKSSASKAKKDC